MVLSTYGVDNTNNPIPIVNIYDSLWTGNTSKSTLNTINAIMPWTDSGKYDIRHMKCDRQPNSVDCGPHAIANVVTLVCGEDPATVRYLDSPSIRQHLLDCLEQQNFTLFPSVDFETDDTPVHSQSIIETPRKPNRPPTSNKLSSYLPKLDPSPEPITSPVIITQRGRRIKKTKRDSYIY